MFGNNGRLCINILGSESFIVTVNTIFYFIVLPDQTKPFLDQLYSSKEQQMYINVNRPCSSLSGVVASRALIGRRAAGLGKDKNVD